MSQRKRLLAWHAGPPEWGPAIIAGLGCALPLLLGLASGHPGFLWASVGAFLASLYNPLHRFGMLRLLALALLGACSAGLGFWSAESAILSLGLFGLYGFLLAWLQRLGSEAGKLGLCLLVCLCLGQGQHGQVGLRNADAVAALFFLGGLWVALLAFGLRGLHGLRMWPYMPRLMAVFRVLRRHAKRLPERRWRLHALGCSLACAAAGLIVQLAELERGHWLSLALLASLQLEFRGSLARPLLASLASLCAATLLIYLGHSLQSPPAMVALVLPLIVLCRALQARRYGLFMLQVILSFVLLAESLAPDWLLAQERLFNSLVGTVLAMLTALLLYGLEQWLGQRRSSGATQGN
ncbi:MAG: FUSC family protein [Pseudomonadaceae bacterium]|nr:FUSC family protein [Pseudomonadaceae bacterium]